MKRYLENQIFKDLQNKMAFIGGPRQVGKTTMSLNIAHERFSNPLYLNWDYLKDKKAIKEASFSAESDLIIFDELHKFRGWKNHIKGIYDKNKDYFKFVVTGSARLNMYKKGGDSLLGRYVYFRLHPLSVAELLKVNIDHSNLPNIKPMEVNKSKEILQQLLKFGGFPEPYFKGSSADHRRWQSQRVDLLVKEDIRETSILGDIGISEQLAMLLPSKTSSLLSINSLAEDINVNFRTAERWLRIFEEFYYAYRIYPFMKKGFNSLKKQSKLYLWDWSEVENEGAKFENLIASHLLKYVHFIKDVFGFKSDLKYVRDVESREADFLVTVDDKPLLMVEAKLSDAQISKELRYLKEKINPRQTFLVTKADNVNFVKDGIHVVSAHALLAGLV